MAHNSYIAFGGNMGDVREAFREAYGLLEAFGHQITAISKNYRSTPWGKLDQPIFWNAVIALTHHNSPLDLLDQMQHIERQLGRAARHELNGPRPIDLDLLLCDQLQLHTKTLILPHPRMTGRPFVMLPLAEIAPDLPIPPSGKTASSIAARLLNIPGEAGSIIDVPDYTGS